MKIAVVPHLDETEEPAEPGSIDPRRNPLRKMSPQGAGGRLELALDARGPGGHVGRRDGLGRHLGRRGRIGAERAVQLGGDPAQPLEGGERGVAGGETIEQKTPAVTRVASPAPA